ncbi:MAG: hypothetical protein JOZ51_13310 [Chloroflexi bacterium]|nr:hypothetical protein [Chloroflexota bacterium]
MWRRSDNDPAASGGFEEYSSAGLPTQRLTPLNPAVQGGDETLRVAFKVFRSTFKRWPELLTEAATFATHIGRERLISISHSADSGDGVVTVWFWADWTDDTPSK